jgi:phage-related holin
MRLFETFDLRAGQQFLASLTAPVDRLLDAPGWAKGIAIIAALVQYIETDAFGGTLTLVVVTGIIDFYVGTKAARWLGVYDPRMAHAGAMGKVTGVLFLLITRLMEHFLFTESLLNTRGAVATAIGMSLVLVDLQSIAHHRETFGATPIPVLSQCLDLLQRIIRAKIPPTSDKP